MGLLMGAWFGSARARKANSCYSLTHSSRNAKHLKFIFHVKLNLSDVQLDFHTKVVKSNCPCQIAYDGSMFDLKQCDVECF
jgi:hypothetical protein